MTPTNTSRQFWIQSPGRGELRSAPLREPGGDEVRVRTLFTGISRGTETLVFRGEVPESQFEAMRAPFQEGAFPAPVKYGYMNVGVVEADPSPRTGRDSLDGVTVFCLHPHQDRYVVPAAAVAPLPAGLPPGRAVLAANVETALNAVWDGGVLPGDRVAVVGAGVVGLLVAWICRGIPGTVVVAVDPDRSRERAAAALSVTLSTTPPPWAGSADVVFHASGTPEGARAALQMAGVEARVVELSWFGNQVVPLPLGEGFHSRRLTLRSSQVGRIPADRSPRWNHARRMGVALELLRAPELDALVSGESPFEELPTVMEMLARGGEGTLCHRIRYP
jgi:threonine dehydrogenase-like Zn-dependent dehydrogenase